MVMNVDANDFTHLSCRQWEDTMFESTCHKRQVNVVWGNLVCLHYPGEVTQSIDSRSRANYWADYALSPDVTYGTA
jgi:hypothetical protein